MPIQHNLQPGILSPSPGLDQAGPDRCVQYCPLATPQWSSLICNSGDSVAPASLWSPVLGLKRDLTARFARTSSVGRHLVPALGVGFHGLVTAIERASRPTLVRHFLRELVGKRLGRRARIITCPAALSMQQALASPSRAPASGDKSSSS